MALGTLVLAFVAGALSILSPCVLPIIPIVLGAAISQHRWGPAVLAAGVAFSFVTVGLFAATVGYSIGLDGDRFRVVAAGLMVLMGAVLVMPRLQAQLASVGGPIANWGDRHIGSSARRGLAGQAAVGLLLGMVWSPCVGPTLGAATILAAQGRNVGQVTATMLAFGLGAAIPLALLGLLSREAMNGWRSRLMAGGVRAKMAFALVLLAIGFSVLSGLDKRFESVLVERSPKWLTNLTTRF